MTNPERAKEIYTEELNDMVNGDGPTDSELLEIAALESDDRGMIESLVDSLVQTNLLDNLVEDCIISMNAESISKHTIKNIFDLIQIKTVEHMRKD